MPSGVTATWSCSRAGRSARPGCGPWHRARRPAQRRGLPLRPVEPQTLHAHPGVERRLVCLAQRRRHPARSRSARLSRAPPPPRRSAGTPVGYAVIRGPRQGGAAPAPSGGCEQQQHQHQGAHHRLPRNATSAARSAGGSAITRSRAARASPPCHSRPPARRAPGRRAARPPGRRRSRSDPGPRAAACAIPLRWRAPPVGRRPGPSPTSCSSRSVRARSAGKSCSAVLRRWVTMRRRVAGRTPGGVDIPLPRSTSGASTSRRRGRRGCGCRATEIECLGIDLRPAGQRRPARARQSGSACEQSPQAAGFSGDEMPMSLGRRRRPGRAPSAPGLPAEPPEHRSGRLLDGRRCSGARICLAVGVVRIGGGEDALGGDRLEQADADHRRRHARRHHRRRMRADHNRGRAPRRPAGAASRSPPRQGHWNAPRSSRRGETRPAGRAPKSAADGRRPDRAATRYSPGSRRSDRPPAGRFAAPSIPRHPPARSADDRGRPSDGIAGTSAHYRAAPTRRRRASRMAP